MEGYLVQFVEGLPGQCMARNGWLGGLIYECLAPVPEDCRFVPSTAAGKKQLCVEVGTLGSRLQKRKDALYQYYLPRSKQALVERYVKTFFDNLLALYLESPALAGTDIKDRIESFCHAYRIDFGRYYDTLKKKYYRYRQSEESFQHDCPAKKDPL